MNLLDVVILVVMLFLMVRGVMRGFVSEVASLAGIILGIWLAIRYMTPVTASLRPHLPSFSFLPVVGFALIFLSVLIACNLAGWGLRILFKKTALGWADRGLGAGLAIVKGVVVTYLAIVILAVYFPPSSPVIAQSRLAPLVTASFQVLKRAVSPEQLKHWKRRFTDSSGPVSAQESVRTDRPTEKDSKPDGTD